jgi:hypothetical protein
VTLDLAGALARLTALDDAAARREVPRGDIDRLFDELVAGYEVLPEEDRAVLRSRVQGCRAWSQHEYWSHQPSYYLRFRDGGDSADLRRALMDASLFDGWPDVRDTLVGLGLIRQAAERHGLDAAPVLEEVAAVSSPEDRTGFGAMRELLSSRQTAGPGGAAG